MGVASVPHFDAHPFVRAMFTPFDEARTTLRYQDC